METLSLAGVGLPANVIVQSGLDEDRFLKAVSQCANAGLVTADVVLRTHPLFEDFFWHRLHRSDYTERALRLADAIKTYLISLDRSSSEFVTLLPVAYRLFALAGRIATANALRQDLSGELEATAVLLYNRRNYALANEYISTVLQHDPKNWRMRGYAVRILIRQEQWKEASAGIESMLSERPSDLGILHLKGWMYLRQHEYATALKTFNLIIAKRDHVASLRDAAECLHHLNRDDEALRYLEKAKAKESENPFVLDLESRIYEKRNQLEPAFNAAQLAAARDPLNANFQNRLGIIRVKQGRSDLSIEYFLNARHLDRDLFSPVNSLTSAYLDTDDVKSAEELLDELKAKARTPSERAVLEHTRIRISFQRGSIEDAEKMLKTAIAAKRNLAPNLGLLVQVECAIFDSNFPAFLSIASVALTTAEDALRQLQAMDSDSAFIEPLRRNIADRKRRI